MDIGSQGSRLVLSGLFIRLLGRWKKRRESEGHEIHSVHARRHSPRLSIVTGLVPPSRALCKQAFVAHQRAMLTILRPAMRNVVRETVLEANDRYKDDAEEPGIQVDREVRLAPIDPVIKAARMSPEDVFIALRDEGSDLKGSIESRGDGMRRGHKKPTVGRERQT
ncbi:hypothetical protein C8J56DRAFT_525074 [Mycena floridula]|nr:hypothetical protein C8J56DRAFT_525074 [Mycena floridula]